ncbi:MAG: hypothetical protein H6581_16480 [Bacteroidia bacterium]|nr:hypothetical protein [Bacteroidia bacterium]
MKRLRNISLYLAAIILLMHCLVPHVHEQLLSQSQHLNLHKSSDTMLEKMSLMFHEYAVEGDLENFQSTDQVSFDLDFPAQVAVFFVLRELVEPVIIWVNQEDKQILIPPFSGHYPSLSNRPPPVV